MWAVPRGFSSKKERRKSNPTVEKLDKDHLDQVTTHLVVRKKIKQPQIKRHLTICLSRLLKTPATEDRKG